MKDEELKITKERVLAAADSCGTAKEVLRKLFPDVFEDEWEDITLRCRFEPDDVSGHPGPRITCAGIDNSCILDFDRAVGTDALRLASGFKVEGGRIWRKKYR